MPTRAQELADDFAKQISMDDSVTDVLGACYDVLAFALALMQCDRCRAVVARSIVAQALDLANKRAVDFAAADPNELPTIEACRRMH
jgi:hypothetical protein